MRPTQADLCRLLNQKLKQVADLQAQVQELQAEIEILKGCIKYGPEEIPSTARLWSQKETRLR